MNIENGGRALIELSSQGLRIPVGLRSYTVSARPDFAQIYGDHPFSMYIGIPHQGWLNGSVAKQVHNQDMLITKQHGLNLQTAENFVQNSLKTLRQGREVPEEYINALSYVSWDSTMSFLTYFAQRDDGADPLYWIQMAYGNPNGKEFLPHTMTKGHRSELQDSLHTSIADQLDLVARHVQNDIESPHIRIEGKLMNEGYDVQGLTVIDLYRGAPVRDGEILNHANHIKAHQESSQREV